MSTTKQKRRLTKFFEPYVMLQDNGRKMKQIYQRFKDENDFVSSASLADLKEILELVISNILIRREMGYEKQEEFEVLEEINNEIEKRETKQHEIQS